MQKQRLFQLLYYILEKRKVTASELAEKLEVSVRTIYRDIDVLSRAGIPIYTMKEKDGGIAILDNFILERLLFSQSEQELMLNALQGLAVVEEKETMELMTKLSSLFQVERTSWIEVDFSNWHSNQSKQEQFDQIKAAILQQYVLSFQYTNNLGESIKRKVNPLKLVFKSGDWYFYGYCHLKEECRLFKLTRIKMLMVLPDNFIPPKEPIILNKIIDPANLIEVTLKFDKRIAFRIYDEFSEDIVTDAQGNLYVTTMLPDNDLLYSYIFSFLNAVEVLSPLNVREKLKMKIKKMNEKYEI